MKPGLIAPGGLQMPGAPRPPHHPYANLFPMLADERRQSFRGSLQRDGQNRPIVLHGGAILDGRNRERDLVELGLPVAFVLFKGTNREALDYVIAENLERRDLTDKQRAMIAAKIATLRLGDNQHTRRDVNAPALFDRALVPPANPLARDQEADQPNEIAAPDRGAAMGAADADSSAPQPPASAAASLGQESGISNQGSENIDPERAPIGGGSDGPDLSLGEAATLMNVPRRSAERAAVIERQGVPELKEAVESGPVSLATGEALASVQPEQQKALLASLPRDEAGKLTPEAKKQVRKAAKEVRAEDQAEKRKKRAQKERDLGQKILALPGTKAGLILSDFEWDFKVRNRETGMDRHAANHYVTAADCDGAEDIVERQRERMSVAAPDCIHLMWVPAAFDKIAQRVMELQGFTYVSQFVWIKPGIGTGFWVRECHELLLIGVRGKIPCPAMGEQFRSAIEAPRGAHSEKPDFQYDVAERYFPTLPKIELNARRTRPGWIAWGNEAPEQSPETTAAGVAEPVREAAE